MNLEKIPKNSFLKGPALHCVLEEISDKVSREKIDFDVLEKLFDENGLRKDTLVEDIVFYEVGQHKEDYQKRLDKCADKVNSDNLMLDYLIKLKNTLNGFDGEFRSRASEFVPCIGTFVNLERDLTKLEELGN